MCADCGTRFTDERWKAIESAGWGAPRETHPHLCDDCKQRAITAERQAEHRQPEYQELDQAAPEQKSGGTWLSRFRGWRPGRDHGRAGQSCPAVAATPRASVARATGF
ncbi:hypothetical protein [Streptomyces sp. NPDC057794]|uniref:hypothetical protein n=1 Tax=Streptomyces sp. NPDC057794 TaxID=3346251 RepID=UPI0036BDCC3F